MITLNDFKRLIRPLQNKIFLLLGRAVLMAVNNANLTQEVQIAALEGEVISDMERFQEYGFETYPLIGAEVLPVFFNGNRDHGIAACVHDRRYRPQDLVAGEVAVYTDEDATTPFRIQMKRGRIHFRRSDKEDIDIDTSKTEDIGTSKAVTVPIEIHVNITSHSRTTPTETHTNTTIHIINSPQIILGAAAWVSGRTIVDERMVDLFNNHVHANGGGVGNSGTPTIAMGAAHMTSKAKAL